MDNRITLQIRAAVSLLVSMLLTAEKKNGFEKLRAKVSKVWEGIIGNEAAKHVGGKVEDI